MNKHIEHLGEIPFSVAADESVKKATNLYDGTGRKLVIVNLVNSDILAKHRSVEPITVLCLAGTGTFRAGAELEDSQPLSAGTLITVEGGIDHQVEAEPSLKLLVSKFKNY